MTCTMALTQHTEIEFLVLPVLVSSYLQSELSQPHCWERDVTKPGGREVGNTEEPKPICHSVTGVLTIIGCHHFLIRPVTEKCGNTAARRKGRSPCPPLHHHPQPSLPLIDIQTCVIYVHTYQKQTCKHIKCVRKCCVPAARIKQVRVRGVERRECPREHLKGRRRWILRLMGKKLKLNEKNFLSMLPKHGWMTTVALQSKLITQHINMLKKNKQ